MVFDVFLMVYFYLYFRQSPVTQEKANYVSPFDLSNLVKMIFKSNFI